MTKYSNNNPYYLAREIREKNILVSASAGAGKTHNLIQRLVGRIKDDKISVKNIMAVTFANDAAAEIRERLEKELNEAYIKSDKKDTFLYDQISLLPQAKITTIHSFCLELVRSYSYVLGKDPVSLQNVLDETIKAEIMSEAFDSVYEAFPLEKHEALEELLTHFSARPEDKEEMKKNVYNLAKRLNTLAEPRQWIEKSLASLNATSISTLSVELRLELIHFFSWKTDSLLDIAVNNQIRFNSEKLYLDAIDREGKDSDKDKVKRIMDAYIQMIDLLKEVKQSFSSFDYTDFVLKLSSVNTDVFLSPPSNDYSQGIKNYLAKLTKEYKGLIQYLYEENDWFEDLDNLKIRSTIYTEFVEAFRVEYQNAKRRRNVIDFDDMEHFALEILHNTEFDVVSDLHNKYIDVLVDEYQDTNMVQESIIQLIANPSRNNVFRVGDVKQSIYRFRNAQPELMQKRKKTIDENNVVLNYDKNFRSTETIVKFNNQLFNQLMNLPPLRASYSKDDYVDIGKPEQSGGELVEIHLLNMPEEEVNTYKLVSLDDSEASEDEQGSQDGENENSETEETLELENLEELKNAQPKAIYIANLIMEMKKSSEFKNYSDYTVLVRTHAVKAQLKHVFDEANIPNSISVKTGFFNSDAVQDILLFIHFIIDPSEPTDFIGLCLSDFIQMSEDQITILKLKKTREMNFIDALQIEYPEIYTSLSTFRQEMRGKNLVEIIRAIYGYNTYYDRFCTQQSRANLDLLYEKAQKFTNDNLTLSEFLHLVRNIEEEESSEAIPFNKKDNVVKVMTIHQSKGLQFPVVIYWSSERLQCLDKRSAVIMDSKLGFSMNTIQLPKRLLRKNPVRLAVEMKAIQDDMEEQIRLLYVALTRAEKKMIIVDMNPGDNIPKLNYTQVLSGEGPTRWILSALSEGRNDFHSIIEVDAPDALKRINPKPHKQETLEIFDKPTPLFVFKTPSSKHKKFTHFKLNFDTSIGANHGTVIHELFEKLPHHGVTEAMIKQLQPDISDVDLSAVLSFYEDEIYSQLSQGEITHEYPFYALMGQEVIHGYMDMVSFTKDATYLIDFKTDRVNSSEILLELYTDQLRDYAKVLHQMRPDLPVKTYLYSLALKTYILVA